MRDFDSIYADYSRMVYWAAYNVTGNRDSAMDVSQEVFMHVLKHMNRLENMEDMQLKGWLYRVAVNAGVDMVRRNKREVFFDEPPFDSAVEAESELPEQAAINAEKTGALYKAIGGLDEIYREPIMLHYFSGLNYKEIASMLGVTEGTIKSRMSRARTMLQATLKEGGAVDGVE